jgi:glycosyltransferase involved in cell wall biosynthesis
MTGNVLSMRKDMAYGGERICYYLIEELAKRGHDLYVFSKEGSDFSNIPIKDYVPVSGLRNDKDVHFEAVKKYLETNPIDFDIYQCNYFGDGWDYNILRQFNYVELAWCIWCHIGHQLKMKPFNTISYSNVMQQDFKNVGMDTIKIHYGLPTNLYQPVYEKDNYACWIGKLEGGKYPKAAIELAKAAGLKIVVMGPPYNTNCFWDQVAPYIDNKNVFWVRGVDDEMKQKIMSKAKCFIYSNDNTWKEHFGIVLAEALAMGTPIIAFNRINQDCSVVTDQIVQHGKHGFVLNYKDSNNLNEIIETGLPLIARIDQIDKRECRKWFEERFTIERMADRYEFLYEKIKDGSRFETLDIQ